jgi:haloacid dehalogenase superfamily, subfamily IA, variant 3 with third motif having DD or ED
MVQQRKEAGESMITTIVLDIGQVLADFCWQDYLDSCGYSEEIRARVEKATVKSKIWKEYDRGALEDEELAALCCELDPDISLEIRQLFADVTKLVRPFDYASGFIRDLKAGGYKVYLLSNYGKTGFEYAKKNFEFLSFVDGGVISYEIKCVKPEPEIYLALIEKYDIHPQEAVFLDDLEANLAAAEKLGFHTVQVRDFNQAMGDLRDLGVRI